MYSFGVLQGEVTQGSITLVTDQTSYAVPTSPVFEQMSGKDYRSRVMTNSVNNHRLFEYQGGFDKLFADQPNRANFTGQPQHWTMNPTNNKFEIDRTPTSGENGDIYKFLYDGRIDLTSTSRTFPFSDTVVDSLVPVVAEIVKLSRNKASRDPVSGNAGFNRAMRMIMQKSTRKSYGTWRARRIGDRGPFED
ncbi:hypothetical protein LCGC14_2949190 [marine sediment metagenome]|uniref:Uncharacterized protein n=1 Tax=marine sediment metagenome TaxID=412755 RepID=A0A0F9A6Z3_9ZZZZ